MKPLVTFPDPERLVVDLLDSYSTTPVAAGVPPDWIPSVARPAVIAVDWDGTPVATWPVVQGATVRVTTRSASPTTSKRLALDMQARLLAGPWPTGIGSIQFLTGILPARDPDTRVEMASFTVRVNVRSTLAP